MVRRKAHLLMLQIHALEEDGLAFSGSESRTKESGVSPLA